MRHTLRVSHRAPDPGSRRPPAAAQAPRRRPRGQAGRRPSPGAPRGPAAGLRDPRVGHQLGDVAGHALLQQPGRSTTRPSGSGASTPSSRSWPRSGPGRTTTATWSSSCGGRQVARWPAVHLEGREVHLRRGARGRGGARQAPDQSPQGVVRQRRRDRGARPLHGGLPPEAAAALADRHARLRLLPGDPRPRAARRAPLALHRHRPLQVQGVEARRSRWSWCATRTTS